MKRFLSLFNEFQHNFILTLRMDSGNPRTSPYICEKKAKAEKRAIEY